jgi:pantetheine-phosphate adenylyltransferase
MRKAAAIIRGLRAVKDFEYEFQMALMNKSLYPEVETIFLMPSERFTYVNSSIVREVARLGGDVTAHVPSVVAEALRKKF